MATSNPITQPSVGASASLLVSAAASKEASAALLVPAATPAATPEGAKEKVNAIAIPIINVPPAKPAATLGTRIWTVITDFMSGLQGILSGIWSVIESVIFEDNVLDDTPKPPRQSPRVVTNANILEKLETQFAGIHGIIKLFEKVNVPDFSTPKGFISWLKLPLLAEKVEHDIAFFNEERKSIGIILKDLITNFSAKKKLESYDAELLKIFHEQEKQLERLNARAEQISRFSAKEACDKNWIETFASHQSKILETYRLFQSSTLGSLKNMQRGGKALSKRKELAPYDDYMGMHYVLYGLSTLNDRPFTKMISALKIDDTDSIHKEIQQIGSLLARPFKDQIGLLNFNNLPPAQRKGRGNTCWLNTSLQVIRRTPALMDLIRAPIQRRVETESEYKARLEAHAASCYQHNKETEEQFKRRKASVPSLSDTDSKWNNRQRVHASLNGVLNAMEMGNEELTKSYLEELEELIATLPEVPGSLRNNRGAHKDISEAILFFLKDVIGYSLKFQAHKITSAADLTDKLEIEVVWNYRIKNLPKDCPFIQRLEAGARDENIVSREDGIHTRERRLSELPRFFITMANRFEGDDLPNPSNPASQWAAEDQSKLEALLKSEPALLNKVKGLVKLGLQKNQAPRPYGHKVNDPVNFPKDQILDLSKSFLTKDLPEGVRKCAKFQLTSFACHVGGLGGGHYSAFGKGEDGSWRHYDDHIVFPVKNIDNVGTSYLQVWQLIEEVDVKAAAAEAVPPVPVAQTPAATANVNTTNPNAADLVITITPPERKGEALTAAAISVR